MAQLSKQMMDLRLFMTEEEKKNGVVAEMKKEIRIIKENVAKIMKENAFNANIQNKELEAMKRWMTRIVKLPQYIDLFVENGFDDMETITEITMSTLTQIGIEKIGHKMKIIKAVTKLNVNHNDNDNEGAATEYI